ncbi:FmdB family zinc ribbon protein [Dethiobacter alkaliphilus]|uniref:FmdB family zinc ribbon protein n=1 Tax=Dethiobacter alkaliphilus TaxID=427926 RepID=UPI002225CB72|nr:zinc ribbon domain-containing protein [Dethiobacter alkaliphilus]MCW3489881.1 zinc ribbon domain-containing protein [Dethiobacter alkaliphilus]
MPTYEFICKQCGHRFETQVPSADKKNVRCVQCESADLQEKFGINVSKGGAKESPCAQSDSCPSKRFGFG